jgi:formiminotetrahydrofolate cyclodeaminase
VVQWCVSEMGSDFESWFARLATKPLPGGVAAAAVAASMGSALVSKVCRLTLAQSSLSDHERGMVGSVLDLAEQQGAVMMGLVREDEQGYQAVLDTGRLPESSPERRQAWQTATETPLRLAEGCREMLGRLPALFRVCLPAASVDLRAGCWLLEVGLRTGLTAAESNLICWREGTEVHSFLSRAERLRDVLLERSWCDV